MSLKKAFSLSLYSLIYWFLPVYFAIIIIVKLILKNGLKSEYSVITLLKIEFRDRGFGGIYGVGKAAAHPPALAVLKFEPAGAQENTIYFDGVWKVSLNQEGNFWVDRYVF